MKLQLGDIYNARESFGKVGQLVLPGKLSYKVAKQLKLLSDELTAVIKGVDNLIAKWGDEPKKMRSGPPSLQQKTIGPKSKYYPEFIKGLDELLDTKIELNIEQIILPDDIRIEPGTLIAVEKFFIIAGGENESDTT